jgi:5-methylcytosine-specific restriction endonuclease McrA
MDKALDPLSKLSDREVVSEVKRLARVEAQSTADLVAMLAVFDARKLYLGEGCSSVYAYCTRVLKLSEHAAYNRIEAARAVNRFPVIQKRLAESEISLTAITLLSAHLTPENHLSVLDEARHKSKSEILKIAARLSPRPDVPATIRKLPAPRSAVGEASEPVSAADTTKTASGVTADPGVGFGSRARASDLAGGLELMAPVGASGKAAAADTARGTADRMVTDTANSGSAHAAVNGGPTQTPTDAANGVHATITAQGNGAAAPAVLLDPSRHRPVLVPLAPERYKVQMTIGAETLSKLRRAQDLLRHQVPDGDLSVVFDRALTLLVTELERKKCAIVSRPRERGKAAAPSKTGKAGAVVEAWGNSNADVAGGQVGSATGGRPAGEHKSANCSQADKPNGSATIRRNKPLPDSRTDAKPGEAAPGNRKQPVLATPAEGGKPEVRERGSARRSRHIPARVKREVWRRDRGRCTYIGPEGRCEQTGRLEYHHVVPYAVGGDATVDTVQLQCAGHNRYEATQFFGFDCSRFSKKRADGVPAESTGSGTSSRLAREGGRCAQHAERPGRQGVCDDPTRSGTSIRPLMEDG